MRQKRAMPGGLIRGEAVGVKGEKHRNFSSADIVGSIKVERGDRERNAFRILMEAQDCWNRMGDFRKDRERNKRYTYGDQWGDKIEVDGCSMTEEQYIKKQGNVPMKTNLIRRLVNTIVGLWRSQNKEPTCMARAREEQSLGETMTITLQANMSLNMMSRVNARSLEEFLISGLIIHRKSYGWRNNKLDCWTDMVSPNNFFIDCNMRDVRGWDAQFCGEVHDISFEELCSTFARSVDDYKKLRDIYRYASERSYLQAYGESFGYSRLENYDFLWTSEPNRCRVIEVWRKETKGRWRCHDYNSGEIYKIEEEDYVEMVERVNEKRILRYIEAGGDIANVPLIEAEWIVDDFWYYYYLTPFGDILSEGETPYWHESHPYVFLAYPFIDGEIHSFVADVIDQQRYTNRLITMYDWIMRASAKGLLMFPEECLPDGMSMDEIADEWTRYNGMIVYKSKGLTQAPKQIANNSTNIGITELLNLQISMFENISGVNGALQGKSGWSGQSAAMYAQQTQNATTSLLDILETFSEFILDGATKDVQNIQQFYDDRRMIKIAGDKGTYIEYEPEDVRDVQFDLCVEESVHTPIYRMMSNEVLTQLLNMQAIDVEQYLEHGDFPFADALLQDIKARKEEAEQQAQMQQMQSPMPQGAMPQEMPQGAMPMQ